MALCLRLLNARGALATSHGETIYLCSLLGIWESVTILRYGSVSALVDTSILSTITPPTESQHPTTYH